MRDARRASLVGFAVCVLAAGVGAYAQGATPRSVAPGEVVTVAVPFGPFASMRRDVAVDVRPPAGWTVLDAPRRASFEADVRRTVLVTVAVPPRASAGRAAMRVTLAADTPDARARTVAFDVRARPSVTWTLVEPAARSPEGGVAATLDLRNDGNADLALTLRVTPQARVVPRRVDLARGGRVRVAVRWMWEDVARAGGAERGVVSAHADERVLARRSVPLPAASRRFPPEPEGPRFVGTVKVRTETDGGGALTVAGRTRDRDAGRATFTLDATVPRDGPPNLDLRVARGGWRVTVGHDARAAVPERPRTEGFGVAVRLDPLAIGGGAAAVEGFVQVPREDGGATRSSTDPAADPPALHAGAHVRLAPGDGWGADAGLVAVGGATEASFGVTASRPVGRSGAGVASGRARVHVRRDATAALRTSWALTARWRGAHHALAWAYDGASGGANVGRDGGPSRTLATTASWWPDAGRVGSVVARARSERGARTRDALDVRAVASSGPWTASLRVEVGRDGVGSSEAGRREGGLTLAAGLDGDARPWWARAEAGVRGEGNATVGSRERASATWTPSVRLELGADLGGGVAMAEVRRWRPAGGASPELRGAVAWDGPLPGGLHATVSARREGPVAAATYGADVALEAPGPRGGTVTALAYRGGGRGGPTTSLSVRWAGTLPTPSGFGGADPFDVAASLHVEEGGGGWRAGAELAVARPFAVPLAPPPPTGRVEGTLVGPAGPWAGAEVRIGERVVTTDAQGVFRASGLPVGETYLARGDVGWPFDARLDPPPPHRVTVRAGEVTHVRYRVVRTGVLTGVVNVARPTSATDGGALSDASGVDVGAVEIVLTRAGERRVVRPGSDGRWRRTHVRPGTWRVEVRLGTEATRVRAVRAPEGVHLPPGGEAAVRVDVMVEPPTVRTRDGGTLSVPGDDE